MKRDASQDNHRALILFNPQAGSGDAPAAAAIAERHLCEAGWTVESLETIGPEVRDSNSDASRLEGARHASMVLIAGGDGTLREVIADLLGLDCRPPIAIIPTGNANVLAREYAIPLDPKAAAQLAITGGRIAVDCGVANEQLFLAMAGVGYDAIAVRWLHRLRASAIGRFVYRLRGGADFLYTLVGFAALFRLTPVRVSASTSERGKVGGLATIAVLNTAHYAKNWSVAPDACAHDGMLNTRFERGALFLRPLIALWMTARRRLAPPCVARYGRVRELSIEGQRPFAWQLDGEPMPPARSLRISLVPAFFDLVVPATIQPSSAHVL
ncbi:MAG: diacylglycerol kinase family protein [Pseudomonadota bacterium]